ncbi:hypothetical protein [Paratissierella segnis]|jgi:hypothetical protein|uniref:Uncharacterized protein n=1 Tax=Paratissierella segnis TaxID=2763679 RepID=A0A926IJR4_9FIRM|nr:hypothetical protein [Paratissierella segnis]MBC8587731.1 hypothetical protein [Paratissierella segnis]
MITEQNCYIEDSMDRNFLGILHDKNCRGTTSHNQLLSILESLVNKGENINLKNYEIVFKKLIQFIEEENRWAIELMYDRCLLAIGCIVQ